MTLVLPRLTDMVRADEYTLTMEQELRLLDDRAHRSRWRVAPTGTIAPGPHVDGDRLADPWLSPWLQLNDPAEDDMVGVCVFDETDSSRGILIWVRPTLEAWAAWRAANASGEPRAIGCETGIHADPDYRAVFRYALPLRAAGHDTVRWAFRRPEPHLPSWDVVTGGWVPESARRKTDTPEVGA